MVGHRLPERRDRRLVAWAGMAPDLDGLALLAGADAYGRWHHVAMHGIVAAILVTALMTAFARDRLKVAALAFVSFHVHLLLDLLGSGVQWGIHYFWPFSDREFFSPYRWELASWQNWTITAVALLICVRLALVHGRTFAETVLPAKADEAVVETLRRRFWAGGKST
jgi:membrane-bound metal-dependent hydrolase YbcI (DUF457 family)